MTVLGFDRSHFNAEPDFVVFKASGGGLIICKATEGTTFVDSTFAACRAGTEAAGLVFGSYHFARWGDVAAEVAHYLAVASPRAGELLALDAEAAPPAGVDVVAWSAEFCRRVHDATGAWPLIYMNQSWVAGHNWASVAANDGLWLAKYDGIPTGVPTGAWPVLAVKQYSDRGTVAGEPGTVDVDAFQGDLAALLRYAVPGSVAPTPPPPPPPPPVPPAPPAFDVRAWRIAYGQSSPHLVSLQAWLNKNYPAYSHIAPLSTNYGPQTVAVLRQFQARVGIKGGDGRNIGAQTAGALANAGFRG